MTEESPKNIKIADFDYPLPDERIARHPLQQRDRCKLLVSLPDGSLQDRTFAELPEMMSGPGMTVFNNTRVIHARLPFRRATGAAIEIFLLEPLVPEDYVLVFQTRSECEWSCMVGNLKKWKEEFLERELTLTDGSKTKLRAWLGEPCGGNSRRIRFTWDNPELTFASIVEAAGRIPIPPYLKRDTEECDETDYQTVYSKIKGSVAAPTAGLHFTPEVMDGLRAQGQLLHEVTLHVGAGTFQPVKSDLIGEHPMHTETFSVTAQFLRELADHVERRGDGGGVITAVGTTSVRTLETLPYLGRKIARATACGQEPDAASLHMEQWEGYSDPVEPADTPRWLRALADHADKSGGSIQASTAIMIAPGFRWNIVGRMVTNFHQPSSTLLLLVSSFMEPGRRPDDNGGKPQWRVAYDHALESGYRFLSYGDACLLYPREDVGTRD